MTVALTIYVHSLEKYDWTWFVVCFCWGILDSTDNTLILIILGSEFTQKTEQFSVYKFLQSFSAFIGVLI